MLLFLNYFIRYTKLLRFQRKYWLYLLIFSTLMFCESCTTALNRTTHNFYSTSDVAFGTLRSIYLILLVLRPTANQVDR